MSISAVLLSCGQRQKEDQEKKSDFKFMTEQFSDARILRYQVPGFEDLSLNQKKLIYYLSQAAISGRDITYHQNYQYNLLVRKTLEAIYLNYEGDKNSDNYKNFVIYLKKVWFSNGIHHHYSTDKFLPEFPEEYLTTLVKGIKPEYLPLDKDQTVDQFIAELTSILFNPSVAPKRVCLDAGKDLVKNSAANFYSGVNQKEVEEYYSGIKEFDAKNKKDTRISYGLNSKVVKEDGRIREMPWMIGGMYSPAISKIVFWLEKASSCTETNEQKEAIEKLISYYKSGNLSSWDEYNILWLKDSSSLVDYVNGFIEVYGDPLAMKATWEAVVNFKDVEATRRTEIISNNAAYFEEHSPVDARYRKKEVKGISAKVITVAQLGGDCDPTTPIGINLPNANWIRKEYGSKSVTMDNITYAYDQASQGNGFLEEFACTKEEIENFKKNGYLAGNLTTDIHECLGHGSGQLMPGVGSDALKNYHSAIEEARADLFALYYIMDIEIVNLGLVPDFEVGKAEYDSYIRNGLMTQLVRIKPGKDIEQAHMRDRALIAHWVYEKGKDKKIIEKVIRDGKTYFRVNDYDTLRSLFGKLLKEVQRITSEGDYDAAKELVETYGVKVDHALHNEVLERYRKLNIAPYSGFINPVFTLEMNKDTISDVRISYPEDFAGQMLEYSKHYSFLPARYK